MSELKKFPPEVWDLWLTYQADFFAPKGRFDWKVRYPYNECLFCLCFENDCFACIGATQTKRLEFPCENIDRSDMVDLAIERLYREGIFTD